MGRVLKDKTCRIYDKRYYCLYCSKPMAKLPRHLLTVHKNEAKVIQYRNFATREEKLKFETMFRNLGNHKHNKSVLASGKGDFQVVSRPCSKRKYQNFSVCSYCLGAFSKRQLWRHVDERCPLNPHKKMTKISENKGKSSRRRHVSTGKLLFPPEKGISEQLHKAIATMKDDDIADAVKHDSLLRKVGERMCLKFSHNKHQFNHMRNILRELGRLLIELRKKNPWKDLRSYIEPGRFKLVIEASQSIVGFDSNTNKLKIPSLAMKLSADIKKVYMASEGRGY